MTINSNGLMIVSVPDLAADVLSALAEEELELSSFGTEYATWDFYRNVRGEPIIGRGKKFEALVAMKKDIKPFDNDVSSEAVRDYFRKRGYFGHAGAFMQWRRQNPDLRGYCVSILDDNACWRDTDSGLLDVPSSFFNEDYRYISRTWIGFDWHGGWSFVAFREVL